jgi:hypothetical protein
MAALLDQAFIAPVGRTAVACPRARGPGSDLELQQPAARAPQYKLHAHGSREFGHIPPAYGVAGVVAADRSRLTEEMHG